ncbi:LuxR C-terminal-related transcriptional regulator [Aeromonas veronii]|uniref:LuxR C-terminal-related transcriptional regulator n=1 Tax=Aeromonas veronii TaxID=654 RepID=UPI003D1DBD42
MSQPRRISPLIRTFPEGTVKVHVKNILKKLNLHSRIEVAVWVHNEKIIFD